MTPATDIAYSDVPTIWQECRIVSVRAGNVRSTRLAQVQANTNWNASIPLGISQQGVWHTIDLRNGPQWYYTDTATGIVDTETFQPNLPDDVAFVDLSAFAIVTPTQPGANEIQAAFRAPGSDLSGTEYSHQSYGGSGVGIREIQASRVPVRGMAVEMLWRQTQGLSAVSWNFLITGYGADCAPEGHFATRQSGHIPQIQWAGPPPPPSGGNWQIAAEPGAWDGSTGSWAGYTLLQTVSGVPTQGQRWRLRIDAASAAQLSAVVAGAVGGAGSAVLFSGQPGVSIAAGDYVVSDAIDGAPPSNLAIAIAITAGSFPRRQVASGWATFYALGVSGSLNSAAYSSNLAAAVGVASIETE